MVSWLKVQEEVAKRDWIAEITLRNVTPVRIGGYNARPFSDKLNLMERPRTQGIKGLWRWWARAILAGAILRSRGTVGGITDVNNEVSKVLGSTNACSEFFIQTDFDAKRAQYVEVHDLENVPRVKLVTMGLKEGKLERYYKSKSLNLKMVVGARRSIEEYDEDAVMFALSSLIIALIFSGIGSMTTRGFGKLKIESIEAKVKSPTLKDKITRLSELVKDLYQQGSAEEVTRKLRDLISETLRYASRYISSKEVTTSIKIDRLPPCPTLLLDCHPEVFRLETVCISKKDPHEVLECIGKSTLKAEWKRKRGLHVKSVGKNLHTWVLGLPRYQEPSYEKNGKRIRQLTGYVLDNRKEVRRQSPIGFTILECPSGLAVVMYGFLTSEFAEVLKGYNGLTLRHIGVHTTKPTIKNVIGKIVKVNLTNVYDDLLSDGIVYPWGVKRTNVNQSIYDVYRLCFDAAWNFVKQIIMDGCCK